MYMFEKPLTAPYWLAVMADTPPVYSGMNKLYSNLCKNKYIKESLQHICDSANNVNSSEVVGEIDGIAISNKALEEIVVENDDKANTADDIDINKS